MEDKDWRLAVSAMAKLQILHAQEAMVGARSEDLVQWLELVSKIIGHRLVEEEILRCCKYALHLYASKVSIPAVVRFVAVLRQGSCGPGDTAQAQGHM